MQVTGGTLRAVVKMRGLAHVMYAWFGTSAAVGVSFLVNVQLVVLLGAYAAYAARRPADGPPAAVYEEEEEEEDEDDDGLDGDGEEDDDVSDEGGGDGVLLPSAVDG